MPIMSTDGCKQRYGAQLCHALPHCQGTCLILDGRGTNILIFWRLQNAGCGHLHHAHCLGPRKDSVPVGCPSGCPRGNIQREAVPFDQDCPSVIVVWDGDKIDRIPVPPVYLQADNTMLNLRTDAVLSLVERFLIEKKVELDELSVRIHGRDAITE